MKYAPGFDHLKDAVIRMTGHHYYVDKENLLYERVRERMIARGAGSVKAYLDLLAEDKGAEWRALEDAVTVGETYFFRHADHFQSLRRSILPRLISNRQQSRTLRIWSIGCSIGAEPYSIAILLRELLGGDVESWRISITGGDISEKALAAARSARYGAWALRTVSEEERARYFDRDGSAWLLKPEYRSMVRFERQNILDLLSSAPPIAWTDYDLILCRNVLIYFSQAQAADLAKELGRRLVPDGVLLLGHAEAVLAPDAPSLFASPLQTEFVQALKPELPAVSSTSSAPAPPAPPAPAVAAPASAIVDELASDAIGRVQKLADAGEYEQAEQLCRELIARNPTSARLHYYEAVLRQVSDDPVGAEAALKRAIYLDRTFAVAFHRLGALLLASGRTGEARRALSTAMRLVEAMPSAAPLPEGQGVNAGDFKTVLRVQLAELGDAA